MTEYLDDVVLKQILISKIQAKIKDLNISNTEAARRVLMDPRTFNRCLTESCGSQDRLLRIALLLDIKLEDNELAFEVWQHKKLSTELEATVDKLKNELSKQGVKRLDQIGMIRDEVLARNAPWSFRDQELLTRYITRTIFTTEGSKPCIIRQRVKDGFRFYLNTESPNEITIAEETFSSFVQKQGRDAFYKFVSKITNQEIPLEVIDEAGQCVWTPN